MHHNTTTAEMEFGRGFGLCEFKREQEVVNITVPKLGCMLQTVKWFLDWDSNPRCVESFLPALGQGDVHTIVINLGIGKSSDNVQLIEPPAMFSDKGDDIQKGCEFFNIGIRFCEV
jgi:hypothetical protein